MKSVKRKLLLKILAALAAGALAYVLLLKPIGWAADWLLARYGSTPAWSMWFFIGLEAYAAGFLIQPASISVHMIIKFVKFYLDKRESSDAVRLTIYGIKIIQLKGARSKSSDGELPDDSPQTYEIAALRLEISFEKETDFLESLVYAPILETVLNQVLVILLLRHFGVVMDAQITVSAIGFVLAHIPLSVMRGFNSIPAGFYYGFTCAHWMRTSLWKAFWVTAAAHALDNFLCGLERLWLRKLMGKLFGKRTDE